MIQSVWGSSGNWIKWVRAAPIKLILCTLCLSGLTETKFVGLGLLQAIQMAGQGAQSSEGSIHHHVATLVVVHDLAFRKRSSMIYLQHTSCTSKVFPIG